jgi:hypothetical protein
MISTGRWRLDPGRLHFRPGLGYTSTLFTYVVAPVNYPLVDSMHDVAESTDVHLLFRYRSTLDVFVTVSWRI